MHLEYYKAGILLMEGDTLLVTEALAKLMDRHRWKSRPIYILGEEWEIVKHDHQLISDSDLRFEHFIQMQPVDADT